MFIPGYRRTRSADAILSRIERRIIKMNDNLNRLASAVAAVGAGVADVAQALQNHPVVAESDDPQLSDFADKLENAGRELEDIAAQINGEANVSTSSAPVEPNLTADTPSQSATDTTIQGGADVGGSTDSTGADLSSSSAIPSPTDTAIDQGSVGDAEPNSADDPTDDPAAA